MLGAAASPSPLDPGFPLPRQNRDDVRQILATRPRPDFDMGQAEANCSPESILGRRAPHPCPRRQLAERPITPALLSDLVCHDPEDGELASGELNGERGRHRPRGGELPAPGMRCNSIRWALRPETPKQGLGRVAWTFGRHVLGNAAAGLAGSLLVCGASEIAPPVLDGL